MKKYFLSIALLVVAVSVYALEPVKVLKDKEVMTTLQEIAKNDRNIESALNEFAKADKAVRTQGEQLFKATAEGKKLQEEIDTAKAANNKKLLSKLNKKMRNSGWKYAEENPTSPGVARRTAMRDAAATKAWPQIEKTLKSSKDAQAKTLLILLRDDRFK